jgi:hypothetical protein
MVLYLYLRHEAIVDKLAFLYPYYASKNYITYEAKTVDQVEVETKMTELEREFTRLANKDDNATEQEMERLFLDGILYVESKFQGGYDIENKLDAKTGEINRKHVSRKIETVRIAYIPSEKIVLIAGNVSKPQKMIFLETFCAWCALMVTKERLKHTISFHLKIFLLILFNIIKLLRLLKQPLNLLLFPMPKERRSFA